LIRDETPQLRILCGGKSYLYDGPKEFKSMILSDFTLLET